MPASEKTTEAPIANARNEHLLTLAEAEEQGKVTWSDLSTMKHLTCINHPTALYLTKNPWSRTLHWIRASKEFPGSECPCPFEDLRVIT